MSFVSIQVLVVAHRISLGILLRIGGTPHVASHSQQNITIGTEKEPGDGAFLSLLSDKDPISFENQGMAPSTVNRGV